MRRIQTAFAAALLVALTAPLALAQDDDEQRNRSRIQALMRQAMNHMTAGGGLITRARTEQGEAAERSRAEGSAAYDEAVTKYNTCLELLSSIEAPEEAKDEVRQSIYYNTACARSMQGRADEALTAFGRALDAGFADLDHIAKDTDLDPIRDEPRFAQLLEPLRAAQAEEERAVRAEALSSDALFPYDFTITTLDGQPLALADLRGKVALVNYWATGSPPSLALLPHLVELKKQFGDRLVVVGMAWEGGKVDAATIDAIKAVAQRLGIDYPLSLVATREELARVPGAKSLPTTVFIDKQGRVRAWGDRSFLHADSIRPLIEALDAEAAPAPSGGGSLGPF